MTAERRSAFVPSLLAIAAGVLLWSLSSLASGQREPWDATSYWLFAYPAAVAVSGGLGYGFPDRPWRWAVLLFQAQFFAMCVRNGELGNLWPLGMGLFAVIAVPAIVVARIAARHGNRAVAKERATL